MTDKKIYIQSAKQISMQQPLCEQWMTQPEWHQESIVHACDPNFRDYMAAGEARRMGKLMKRAITTALLVMQETAIEHPDAIITGTALGSLDCTERLLQHLSENGEKAFSPTHFMQSTHNTVGSSLGIYTKTHGYNTTYSHGQMSFDWAVLDAWMQIQLGKINNALVGGHEEIVESYSHLLEKIGYIGKYGMVPYGEVAVEMIFNTNNTTSALCELAGISICNCYSEDDLEISIAKLLTQAGIEIKDIDAVMTGKNGNPNHDKFYASALQCLPQAQSLMYKPLFGENFTASAFGLYAAAHCLKKGTVPVCLFENADAQTTSQLRNLLLINQMNGKEYSFILLKQL